MQLKLNDVVMAERRSNKDNLSEAVLEVKIVKGKSLMEYQGEEDSYFAKITMALPTLIAPAKRLLETTTVYQPTATHLFKSFESNVDYELR